jgi:hypothetical protein
VIYVLAIWPFQLTLGECVIDHFIIGQDHGTARRAAARNCIFVEKMLFKERGIGWHLARTTARKGAWLSECFIHLNFWIGFFVARLSQSRKLGWDNRATQMRGMT